ncbi:MAG: hypothetical protein IKP68_01890, partial [Clostridia bacterium]|nr:hypothetical protein [Clostridia bacterium]
LFRVLCSFERDIFRKDKIKKFGNTLCISEFFCKVSAEKSRSKPVSSYGAPPKRGDVFIISSVKNQNSS